MQAIYENTFTVYGEQLFTVYGAVVINSLLPTLKLGDKEVNSALSL